MSENYCPAGKIVCKKQPYCSSLFNLENYICPPSDQVPVKQTLDTVNSYQAGRADMKRECVKAAKKIEVGDSYDVATKNEIIAVIEGVE